MGKIWRSTTQWQEPTAHYQLNVRIILHDWKANYSLWQAIRWMVLTSKLSHALLENKARYKAENCGPCGNKSRVGGTAACARLSVTPSSVLRALNSRKERPRFIVPAWEKRGTGLIWHDEWGPTGWVNPEIKELDPAIKLPGLAHHQLSLYQGSGRVKELSRWFTHTAS